MPDEQTFGALVRQIRLKSGTTQSDLGALTGISAQQISDIEKDRRTVGIERAVAIAEALQQPVPDLLQVLLQQRLREAGLPYKIRITK